MKLRFELDSNNFYENRSMSVNSSGRHKFSTSLSCQRLKRVQNWLKKSSDAQCILAVLGVDGRFNEGCREFANYLTCGFFTLRQNDLEKAGLEEEDIEDVLLLVRSESVSLYCGEMLYSHLLPYVAHWKNLQIFCKGQNGKNTARDTDVEEMFKVRSFLSMINTESENIGIPFLGSSTAQVETKSGKFSIEKWPLIQSYASEDIGCGKFFSLDHAVVDVRPALLSLYNSCDPVAVEKIVSGAYPLFLRHWNEALTVVQNAVKVKTILQMKEEEVLEPLMSYYKHGKLSKFGKQELKKENVSKPYVRFGCHSLELGKDTKSINFKSGASKGTAMPHHFVIHCVAPNSPLRCSRTYFFKQRGKSEDKAFNNLVSLYLCCVEGASMAVSEFKASLNESSAEKKVVEHLLCKGVPGGPVFDAKCKVFACDKAGQNIGNTESSKNIFVVKVSAENIKTSHGGEVIGAVVFSDTFVVSSFDVLEKGESSSNTRNVSCNVLTSNIPAYQEWQIETGKSESKFGEDEPMALCKNLTVCSNSLLFSPSSSVNVRFNQDGKIIITGDNMEEIVLKKGVQYYDSPAPGKVCFLVMNFEIPDNASLWSRVPVHYRGEVNIIPDIAMTQPSKCMVLALIPRTPAYKVFYADVIHGTQIGLPGSVNLYQMKLLSPDLQAMHDKIQNVVDKRLTVTKNTFAKSDSDSVQDLIKHLSISSVASGLQVPENIALNVLGNTVEGMKKSKDSGEKICVTVITGLPCSGAEDICQQLVSLNKEKVRWVVIKPTASLTVDCTLSKETLEDQLAQAVTHKRVARPSAAARKNLRIIILAVGFYDLCEIVQSVSYHSDLTVRDQLQIGAVTACISPNTVYFSDRQNYPKFFDCCLPGIVSNFAFIIPEREGDSIPDKSFAQVQSFVRCINKQAAFLTCPGGKLIRKSDFELVLSEESYTTMKMEHERFLLRPEILGGKYVSGKCYPSLSRLVLEFSQPVLKGTFCARLRGFRPSLLKPQKVGTVCFVNGCISFTDEPKQLYDISFASVAEKAALTPRATPAVLPKPPSKGDVAKPKPYILEFNGIDLNEEALKEWLRKCGKQKPSKKSHKTKNKLTKSEIQMIHEENSTRHLPEGYFYNGSFYVSLFNNEKMLHHPDMQKFIDEYLVEENEEIDAYNADIDRQNIKDVFDA